MARSLLIAVLVLMAATGSAKAQQTDYRCLADCTAAGFMYRFCQDRCSYGESAPGILPAPVPQPAPQIDYRCQADCLAKGYRLQFCQEQCSY